MSINLSNAQFQELLNQLSPKRRGSFASCSAEYDGTKKSETVEAFLAAVNVYKELEDIGDKESLTGLPLLLKGEAAVWWQGVKNQVTTWKEFEQRLRYAFAPKKPAYVIYQKIVGEKQETDMPTETFVAHKRMLFSQLPALEHSEAQQLDMIFGQLKIDIREKVPRNSVNSFDNLLEAARGVEQLARDIKIEATIRNEAAPSTFTKQPKRRCGICRYFGHRTEDCKKMRDKKTERTVEPDMKQTKITQAPSPSRPKIFCYGCGTPDVVRSNCTTCAGKKARPSQPDEISFCSVNIRTDSKSRPTIFVEIDGMKGTAHVDTCAKSSVASYHLYRQLLAKGHKFYEETVRVTLADGFGKSQRVLRTKVAVKLQGRIIPTTFIVLPESRDNRTLLGIGFIQDARMILNLPQFTWNFIGSPDKYELYDEDFTTCWTPAGP